MRLSDRSWAILRKLQDRASVGTLPKANITTRLLTAGLVGTSPNQTQIEAICYSLNQKMPERFVNYTKAGRNTTSSVFGSAAQGVGLKNWLHQIVLGCELLIRLRAETQAVSYVGLMTDETSALLFVCDRFMQDVEIRVKPEKTGLDDPARYSVAAMKHARQSDGLIRFAELLRWPYMDE